MRFAKNRKNGCPRLNILFSMKPFVAQLAFVIILLLMTITEANPQNGNSAAEVSRPARSDSSRLSDAIVYPDMLEKDQESGSSIKPKRSQLPRAYLSTLSPHLGRRRDDEQSQPRPIRLKSSQSSQGGTERRTFEMNNGKELEDCIDPSQAQRRSASINSGASAQQSTLCRPQRADVGHRAEIVFPKGKSFVPKKGCDPGSTFCDNDPEYPQEYINKLLANQGGPIKGLFGQDEIGEEGIAQRIDINNQETQICASAERIVNPRKGKTKDDKWMYIVNHENYMQGVRTEVCWQEDSPCMLINDLPVGYTATCRQKFAYRVLMAMNSTGQLVSETFQFPSCCSCFVKSSANARMGGTTLRKNATSKAKP